MDNPDRANSTETARPPCVDPELPPGDHPLEVAARQGFGPLSAAAGETWHGQAKPCVTCGQLLRRSAVVCNQCGQDLSSAMIEKMRACAGPWDVLEHVRPFPGVSLDRIIRQIRRGLITETSIVRGPSTDHQWRFAVEAPGLCRYFNRCWQCHAPVTPADSCCPKCLAHLSFERPRLGAWTGGGSAKTGPPELRAPAAALKGRGEPQPSPELGALDMLRAALSEQPVPEHRNANADPPLIAGIRATWVAAAMLVVVIAGLLWITQQKSSSRSVSRDAEPRMRDTHAVPSVSP